ncbi:MAG: hypothetical protein R2695_16670 [Acidimicrobiales bacterium]
MYKAAVRALVRHGIRRLNEGDYSLLLKLAHPQFELSFPGDNSWTRCSVRRSSAGIARSHTAASTRRRPSPNVSSPTASSSASRTSWSTVPRGGPACAVRAHDFIPE